MYKNRKALTINEHVHLRENKVFRLYGCTQYAIDRLYKSHVESAYPLCEECRRILVKLGYTFEGGK
jgi:hypothetical protein